MRKCIVILLITSVISIYASIAECSVQAESHALQIYYNNLPVTFPDATPYIDLNNRTLVPIRFPSEAVGAKVAWNEPLQQVTITKNDTEIIFTIGSRAYLVDGKTNLMDTEAVLKEGRTYIPLRFLMEGLGYHVLWHANVVKIMDGDYQPFKIYIDAGHGVNPNQGDYNRHPIGVYDYLASSNTISVGDLTSHNYTSGARGEMRINWVVASKLVNLLEQDERFTVMRDRDAIDAAALPNYLRAEKANEWGANLRISIHAERTSPTGYFIAMPPKNYFLPDNLGGYYTKDVMEQSEAFAQTLLTSLDDSNLWYGRWNDGIYRSKVGYIAYHFSKHPVVILEMDKGKDWSNTIEVERNQDIIAESIYEAIQSFFRDQ